MPLPTADTFKCHGCGQCCRRVGDVLAALADAPPDTVLGRAAGAFPYAVDAAGVCSQLQPDNTCGVYLDRPILCNVDAMFDALALPGMSRAQWHEMNAGACPPKATA